MSTTESENHLERGLSNRHIQLIAIGGTIGTGLFMGSGNTISKAGPSVIFVSMIIGRCSTSCSARWASCCCRIWSTRASPTSPATSSG